MANAPKVERIYGKERSIGEVIYNPQTKAVIATINGGIFGKLSLTLKMDNEGGFDMLKAYKDKSGNEQVVKFGKLFSVKDKAGNIVEGLSKGTLGLLKQYDKELKKEITSANDCLIVTTHKLKQNEAMGDSGWLKVGYITGQYAVETNNAKAQEPQVPAESFEDINDEEIPF